MNPRRTEALSDSTFAVAMTLLIFDVRLPAPRIHSLSRDLWFSAWPHYLGYVISFMVIGMIWVSHHTIFRLVQAIDHGVMVVNLALLSLVVFIPFPTQVLALYISQGSSSQKELAVAFYGLSLAAATLMLAVLWHSITRRALIQTWVGDDELKRVTRRYYLTPVLYLVATGLALVDDRVGIALFLIIGSGYLLHTGTRVAPSNPDDLVGTGGALED
ncbi:MAG: TMEM175 family protein [Acidimicrobiales bacterium]